MNFRKVMIPSPEVRIEEGPKVFSMYYGGNGDLYWQIKYKGIDEDLLDGEIEIGQEIPELFEQFNTLYSGIAESSRTDNFIYGNLFEPDTNTITWYSDNDISPQEANILYVTKGEQSFKIRIVAQPNEKGKVKDEGQDGIIISVRFRGSGSKYGTCNLFFTNMYHSLLDLLEIEASTGNTFVKKFR